MNSFWWTLPGPARFVDKIIRDLRDGKNVVICLPAFAPGNLAATVDRRLLDESGCSYRALDLSALQPSDHNKPLHFLIQRLQTQPEVGVYWRSKLLLEDTNLHGRWFWLAPIDADNWRPWRDFIAEYAHMCRAYIEYERPLFVLVVHGVTYEESAIDDVCLSVHRWSGYVDRLDMLLFTKQMMMSQPGSLQAKEIVMAMIAELAQWDPHVVPRLVGQALTSILQPKTLLQQLAQARNWSVRHAAEASWAGGTINTMENGDNTRHAALLALYDPLRELEARLWTAQVRVTFPFLETERRRLLTELRNQLSVPYATDGGYITELHDLELSHIANQINTLPNQLIKKKVRNKVSRLRDIRNKLAHLEVLTAEMIARMYQDD